MKITKNIELFDKNSFEVGALYYLNFEKMPDEEDFDGDFYNGIFVCILVSSIDDYVHLYPIKYFTETGDRNTGPITIDNANYKYIRYVSKLFFNCEKFIEGYGNKAHLTFWTEIKEYTNEDNKN